MTAMTWTCAIHGSAKMECGICCNKKEHQFHHEAFAEARERGDFDFMCQGCEDDEGERARLSAEVTSEKKRADRAEVDRDESARSRSYCRDQEEKQKLRAEAAEDQAARSFEAGFNVGIGETSDNDQRCQYLLRQREVLEDALAKTRGEVRALVEAMAAVEFHEPPPASFSVVKDSIISQLGARVKSLQEELSAERMRTEDAERWKRFYSDKASEQRSLSDSLTARISSVTEDAATHEMAWYSEKERAEAAEEELADVKDSYSRTVSEACDPPKDDDRVHCTCIPSLRAEVASLREQRAASDDVLAAARGWKCFLEAEVTKRDPPLVVVNGLKSVKLLEAISEERSRNERLSLLPYDELRYPTRQRMREEISRLTSEARRLEAECDSTRSLLSERLGEAGVLVEGLRVAVKALDLPDDHAVRYRLSGVQRWHGDATAALTPVWIDGEVTSTDFKEAVSKAARVPKKMLFGEDE